MNSKAVRLILYCNAMLIGLVFLVSPLAAQEVGLVGLLGSKAILMINGGEPQPVRVGDNMQGVRLVSVQDDQAVVEIAGKKRVLRIGQHAVGTPSADGKLILKADSAGHFMSIGTVNGVSLRFVVDTGASMISLGAGDARRLGLDAGKGERLLSNTANGQTVVTKVSLNTVRLGDITLNNVDAVIHQTDMPVALLGMSFLNRMEMQRDGDTMTLKKRF